MMTTQFTPGPWSVESEESPLDFEVDLQVIAGEKTICSFFDRSKEDYANARLIAAAPELLEALKTLVKNVPFFGEDDFDKARAAISKASGTSEIQVNPWDIKPIAKATGSAS